MSNKPAAATTADGGFRREAMRIGGEKIGADRQGDRVIEVFNPFTRQAIGSVPKATVEEVRNAPLRIAAGYKARLTRYERAEHPEQGGARRSGHAPPRLPR